MFEILSWILFPVYKLSQENTQPENVYNIIFEKAEAAVGRVF